MATHKTFWQLPFETIRLQHGKAVFRLSKTDAVKLLQIGKKHKKWTSSAMLSGLGSRSYDVSVKLKEVTFFEQKMGKKHHKTETKRQNEDLDNAFSLKSTHKKSVSQALAQGEKVPQDVLKDYPDLKISVQHVTPSIMAVRKSTRKATKKPTPKATPQQKPRVKRSETKAKQRKAGKSNYKGSVLESINKSATALQQASGTKQITVPKLDRKEAMKRAAALYKKGTF